MEFIKVMKLFEICLMTLVLCCSNDMAAKVGNFCLILNAFTRKKILAKHLKLNSQSITEFWN